MDATPSKRPRLDWRLDRTASSGVNRHALSTPYTESSFANTTSHLQPSQRDVGIDDAWSELSERRYNSGAIPPPRGHALSDTSAVYTHSSPFLRYGSNEHAVGDVSISRAVADPFEIGLDPSVPHNSIDVCELTDPVPIQDVSLTSRSTEHRDNESASIDDVAYEIKTVKHVSVSTGIDPESIGRLTASYFRRLEPKLLSVSGAKIGRGWVDLASRLTSTVQLRQRRENAARVSIDLLEYITDPLRGTRTSDGHTRLTTFLRLLDAFGPHGFNRSNVQKCLHHWFTCAALPLIYGDDWDSCSNQVMAEFGIKEINYEVFALTPRR